MRTDAHCRPPVRSPKPLDFPPASDVPSFELVAGAVLTAFVGFNGLIERMASDRCLPQFLLQRNRWRDTTHYIILVYLVIAVSQVIQSTLSFSPDCHQRSPYQKCLHLFTESCS
jgi:hypothetical protein